MIARMKFVGLAVSTALLLLAATASGASAKTVLELKTDGGAPVTAGTTVDAGWYVGLGEKYFCQELNEEEPEESMVLNVNGSAKDKASGDVKAPPCFEEEAEGGGSDTAMLKRGLRAPKHRSIFDAASTTSISASGALASQEMTNAKKATLGLSAALIVTLESAGKKCAYESKTKLKGTWPPEASEELPNIGKTADIAAEVTFKLDKSLSAKSGCAKTEPGFVEAWLGPLGEELEAELTSPMK